MQSINYFTISQFTKKHPAFTEGGIRWRIFNAKENGLYKSGAVIKDGRKILIDEIIFFDWLKEQSTEQGWG